MDNNKTEIVFVEKQKRESRLANLSELLSYKFIIPLFQRPYAWDAEHFKDLLETIIENRNENREAFLGSVIVALKKDENASIPGKQKYLLIDGQQRITSFLILLKFTLINLENSISKLNAEMSDIQKSKKEAESSKNFEQFKNLVDQEKTIEKKKNEYENAVGTIKNILTPDKIIRESSSGDNLEKDVLDYISSDTHQSNKQIINNMREVFDSEIEEIENISIFLNYILDKCTFCFLVVTGNNSEDYAIDIFNSLNSTGEPLTAFEILKSSIHKKFKNDNNNQKELTEKFNKIEKQLQNKKFKKVKQNKYTDRLLLFIHMMTPELQHIQKISSFRDKKKLIDKILDLDKNEMKKCVDTIYNIHDFILNNWEDKSPFKDKQLDLESKITFNFLQTISHDRILPVLYKFKDSIKDLNDAIKTCVAFTCLWRGYAADGKTDRIDTKYEELIKIIFKMEESTIESLKTYVLQLVKRKEEHIDQSKWVNKFKTIDIYKSQKLARFLLFIAFDRRNFNSDTNRLDESKLRFLRIDEWNSKDYKTIEHITPQGYKTIDKIGNLILLPQEINSKVGKKNFLKKKEIYQKCIDTDPNEMPYIPVLKEIVSYGQTKDLDQNSYLNEVVIAFRGEKLGDSIWQTLAKDWLEWKD